MGEYSKPESITPFLITLAGMHVYLMKLKKQYLCKHACKVIISSFIALLLLLIRQILIRMKKS